MKQFSKEVDLRSRKSMTDFLVNHFRYNTMNSWNQSTSYANNVKVYNLGLSKEQENKLYAMLEKCSKHIDELSGEKREDRKDASIIAISQTERVRTALKCVRTA